MNRARQLLLLIVVSALIGVGAWAALRFQSLKRLVHLESDYASNLGSVPVADAGLWLRSMEKVKEDRGADGGGPLEIPPQLRHYSDRHWFLATQVAEVSKFNLHSFQDFVDLAAMIQRGDMVVVPEVTDTYILYGVGAKADDGAFTRYEDDHNIELYDEAELHNAYGRLESARSKLQTGISDLKTRLAATKKRDRTKQAELQKEITAREQELKSNDEAKALLDGSYGQPEQRQKLLKDYESLKALAKNFGGSSYDLDHPSDRKAMKVKMLSSLRPEALKILEEIAKAYHDRFARPLPVSSLTRPEQYQHALNRVNRNAVLIDTPPHTTGLAFDIDYRYMSAAEQNFLMADLARLKDEGRIEVIRERSANFHVFAFIDGRRPSNELITASLDKATLEPKETNHATKPAKEETKSRTAKKTKTKSRANTSKSKAKRRR